MHLSKGTIGHLACLLRSTIGAIMSTQAIPPRRQVSDAMKRLVAVLRWQLVFILFDLYANRVVRRAVKNPTILTRASPRVRDKARCGKICGVWRAK